MTIRFGAFELDAGAQELRRGGTRIHLTGKPVLLLIYLIERRGEVVSREELQRALWSDGTYVDFEHGLNNAINKLRQALNDSSATPRYIETVPRRGYRFIAHVDVDVAAVAEPKPAPPRRSLPMAIGAALLILAIAGGAVAVKRERASSRASAHEAYLKGREELTGNDSESLARSRAYFERSIRIDRDYAPAHCGLALALNRAGLYGFGDPMTVHGQAIAAANAALELDPGLAEAYVARAAARFRLRWDWRGAEEDLRRAIALDPNFVKPHETYSQLLAAQGRWREALREIATARQLDPLAPSLRRDEGVILYHARQYDAAIARLEAVVRTAPRDAAARRALADAYIHSGNTDAASREFVQWLEVVGVAPPEVDRARGHLARGGFAELWSYFASMSIRKGHSYKLATALAALGRRDEALAALEEAFANRESPLLYLKTDPYLDPLRGDPRFHALLARAHL